MKTAKHIKDLEGFTGRAALYELSEPLDGHKHVVVSAAVAMFSGPETYIFPADDTGKVKEWGELDGSMKGTLDHEDALTSAGYSLS